MIEKERLQELIDSEETIYTNNIGYDKLNLKKDKFHISRGLLIFDYKDFCIPLRDLYETKEKAEWVAATHTKYTERFNPPMFKDLPYEYSFKFIRDGVEHELICKRDSFIVVISCCKDYMSGTHEMEYNKENYEKAVEYARKLFLGVEDE